MIENQALRSSSKQPFQRFPVKNPKETSQASPNTKNSTQGTQIDTSQLDLGMVNFQKMNAKPKHKRNASNNVFPMNTMGPGGVASNITTKRALNRHHVQNTANKKTSVSQILGTDNLMTSIGLQQAQFGQNSIINQKLLNQQFQKSIMINRQESQRMASLQNTPEHRHNTQVNSSYLHDQNQESTEEGSTALGGANPHINMNNISIQEHFQSYAMGDQSLINGSLNTTNQMIICQQTSGSKSTKDPYGDNNNTNAKVHKFLHQESSQEKYQRPYPGYAFQFENVDSYTRNKLLPLGDQQSQFQKKPTLNKEYNYATAGPTIDSTEVDEVHTNTGKAQRTNPGVSSLNLSSHLPSNHYRSTYQNAPHTFRTTNEPLYNSSIQQEENCNEIKTSRRNIPISIEGKLVQQQNDKELERSFRNVQQLQLELQKVDQSFGPRNTLLNLPNENSMLQGNRSSISRRDFQDSRASKNHIMQSHQRNGGNSPRGENQKELEDFKRQVGVTDKRRLNDLPKIKFKILCEDEDQIQSIIRQQRAEFIIPQERYTQSQNVSKRVPPTIRTTNDVLTAPQQIGTSVKTARNNLLGAPLLGPTSDNYGPMFGDASSQLVKSTKNIALYQAQRFKVNRNKVDYFYNPKESEFPEEMLTLSGGNKYHEKNNPQVAKFINSVQGNIKVSNQKKTQMKEGVTKIFAKMKKEKKQYLGTLLEGEEMGHCTGIKVRTDESKQVQQRQKDEKHRREMEEKEADVKAKKLRKDNEKLAAKRMRIQERLNKLEQLSTIPTKKKGESFLNSFKSQLKGNLKVKNQGLAAGETILQGTPTDNLSKTATLTQKVRIQIADGAKKDDKEHDDELLVPDGENVIELQPVVEFQDQLPQSIEDKAKPVELNNNSVSISRKTSVNRDGTSRAPSPYKKGDKKSINTKQSSKKSKVIAQGLNLKLSSEQVKVIEQEIRDDPDGQWGKLFKYFENVTPTVKREGQSKTQGGGNQHKAHQEIFKGPNGSKLLGFDNCPDMIAFFKTICEEENIAQIKYAHLKSTALQAQLQDRYCGQVGDKIFKFLENEFHSLCRVLFQGPDGFLDIISKFLNGGPELYKKFMFACCSLANQGRICEHDVFTLLEKFKQRESFFFYQDLILQKEVPRDFKHVIDNSDQIFFQAFEKDVKLISHMLMMKKRMMGIVDQDTKDGIETDFDIKYYVDLEKEKDEKQIAMAYEKRDEDLIRQIDFIISVIHEKGGPVIWNDAFEAMRDNKDLIQLRNKLCEFVACHGLVKDKQQQTKTQSQLSIHSDSKKKKSLSQQKKNPANQSGISFNNTGCKNPCLGPGKYKRTGNPVTECIFITWKEFNKFLSFKKSSGVEIPSIAEDFIKTISLGKINLRHFERTMAHYRDRDPNGPEYSGYLYEGAKISDGSTHIQQSNIAKRTVGSRTQFKTTEGFTEAGALRDPYIPKHILNQEFKIENIFSLAGEFSGKTLIRMETAETKKRRTQMALGEQQQAQDGSPMKVEKDQDDDKQEKSKINMSISKQQCQELLGFKDNLGPQNFYNIFRCFYLLSHIPNDADNNPFALYIDQASIVRGFFATFGVDYEEVAIRLFNLFVVPPEQAKSCRISLTRFYEVVIKMCDLHTIEKSHLNYAFKFYDYDQSGSIGSVDIVNLFKYFPTAKVEKIFRKFDSCYQKQQDILAEKKKLNKGISFQDYLSNKIDPSKFFASENISDSDREAPPDQSDSQDEDDIDIKSEENPSQNQSGTENEDDNSNSKKASSKNVNKTPQMDKKEMYHILKSKTFFDDENNMISQSINNRWNRVLLETKCLRNYFVDEAVVPSKKVTAADQNFLNNKMFEGHFLSMMKDRYGVETPAILHFFRDRFICCQCSVNKKFGQNMTEELGEKSQLRDAIHIHTFNLNLEVMLEDLGHQKPSKEYMSMLKSLQILSTVPRSNASMMNIGVGD